jgi:hypothetical protein
MAGSTVLIRRHGERALSELILSLAAAIVFTMAACGTPPASNTGDSAANDGIFTGQTISNVPREQVTGKSNGYDWELWNQNRQGNTSMTLGESGGGTFKCSWDGVLNVLFRAGRKFGSTQTHQQIGGISIQYDAPVFSIRGNVNYLSVYGWTQNPLVEFYIVENRGTYNPGSAGTKKGEITVDDSVYDIYVAKRTNQPSIEGNKTFQQ